MFGQRGIGKDTLVIFYDDTGGFRATRLFWMMGYCGHRCVVIVNGGYIKWISENQPVINEMPKVNQATFPVDLTNRRITTADWLLDRQDDTNRVIFLDQAYPLERQY